MQDFESHDEFLLAEGLMPLPRTQYSEALVQEIERCEELLRLAVKMVHHVTGTECKVLTGFFANNGFRAFASTQSDSIAISNGVPFALLELFAIAMNGYRDDTKALAKKPITMKSLGPEGDLRGQVSTDQRMNEVIILSADFALLFIAFHELAHIWNGHTRYCGRHSGVHIIDDFSSENIDENVLDSQTMEMDADASAIQLLLHWFSTMDIRALEGTQLENRYGKKLAPAYLIVNAVYMTFAVWDQKLENQNFQKAKHPVAPIRMRMISGKIMYYLQTYMEANVMTAAGIVLDGMLGAEKAACDIFGKEFNQNRIFELYKGDLAAAVEKKLCLNWVKLRPELDKLKLGGQLAPAVDLGNEAG